MASVKINFPSPDGVYMHDTPQQSLFSKLMRFDSSGCVRVQNVRDLVTWMLRDTPGWDRQHFEADDQDAARTRRSRRRCRCRSISPTSRPGRPATASCSSATTSTPATASTNCRSRRRASEANKHRRTSKARRKAGFFVAAGLWSNSADQSRGSRAFNASCRHTRRGGKPRTQGAATAAYPLVDAGPGHLVGTASAGPRARGCGRRVAGNPD